MDFQEPEMHRIVKPTIQPQANVAQLKAQLDVLNIQENNMLIEMMGGTQDFPNAWSDWHWSSVNRLQMYIY